MKFWIVLALVAVVVALVSAGVFMVRKPRADDPHGKAMARALAIRVGLSVAVFVIVLFCYWMGWIQPSGFAPGQ